MKGAPSKSELMSYLEGTLGSIGPASPFSKSASFEDMSSSSSSWMLPSTSTSIRRGFEGALGVASSPSETLVWTSQTAQDRHARSIKLEVADSATSFGVLGNANGGSSCRNNHEEQLQQLPQPSYFEQRERMMKKYGAGICNER